jgi:N-dimethylarginine dimethylaminohydrolase
MSAFNEYGRLEQVMLCEPEIVYRSADDVERDWRALNYIARPDRGRALDQFAAFEAIVQSSGAKIHHLADDPGLTLDAVYVRDASIVTPRGVMLCHMGKPAREQEPVAHGRSLTASGLSVVGSIAPPGRIEGGDVVWFDRRTVAVGRGYRTNGEGISQFRDRLGPEVEVVVVPLPHYRGPSDVFHLMSMISPVDRDLAVVYALDPWRRAAGLRELEQRDRRHQRVVVADREIHGFAAEPSAVLRAHPAHLAEVAREYGAHGRQVVCPLGGLEGAEIVVPAAESQPAGFDRLRGGARRRVDQQYLPDQPRIRGPFGPAAVALRVARPVLVADGRALELKAGPRARQFAVERRGELRGRRAQRSLHAIPFGFTHLAHPAVLQPGERRHEEQDDRHQGGDAGHAASAGIHGGSLARRKRNKWSVVSHLTSLTSSLPSLNVDRGSTLVIIKATGRRQPATDVGSRQTTDEKKRWSAWPRNRTHLCRNSS